MRLSVQSSAPEEAFEARFRSGLRHRRGLGLRDLAQGERQFDEGPPSVRIRITERLDKPVGGELAKRQGLAPTAVL